MTWLGHCFSNVFYFKFNTTEFPCNQVVNPATDKPKDACENWHEEIHEAHYLHFRTTKDNHWNTD